jgi:hypothetical protein
MTDRTFCTFVPAVSNDTLDHTEEGFGKSWYVSNYLGTEQDEPNLFMGAFEECEGLIAALHFAVTERGKELLDGMWTDPTKQSCEARKNWAVYEGGSASCTSFKGHSGPHVFPGE